MEPSSVAGGVRTWTGGYGTGHKEKGILADAIGPDLRWATATVVKSFRRSAAGGSAQSENDEEEPF